MTLRDLIADDTRDVLMNTEDFAEVATFSQGSVPPFDVTVVLSGGGPTKYEVANAEGFLTVVKMFDWQVRESDFGTLNPRSGAVITRANGDKFELCPVGDAPAVEVLDDFGGQLLLHSKQVLNV